MSTNNSTLDPLALAFVALLGLAVGMIVLMLFVTVSAPKIVENGMFEYNGDVYFVEKAPPGTILRDGKLYKTEPFNQPQTQKNDHLQD